MSRILDKEEIKTILPHRDEMLLLDELIYMDNDSVQGKYYFTGEEWFFKGHFPDMPVVPGFIISEIMAQTCCGLFPEQIKNKIPYLVSVDKARFIKKVVPKDMLLVKSIISDIKKPFYYASCQAYVNDVLHAHANLSFVVK